MRIVRCRAYGSPDVLNIEDVPIPLPKDDEILIRVEASNLTAGDCELRRFDVAFLFWLPLRLMFGLFRPRRLVLGQDVAGIVEKVGASVTRLKPGDAVYGLTGMRFGGHADYVCLPESYCVGPRPANLSAAEAASLPVGGYNASHFLRETALDEGESILVHGAAGTIGTIVVQLAKNMGAIVTAVDAGDKLPTLEALGADHVIDYRSEDFTKNGQQYDVIIDLVHRSPKAIASLKDGGYYLLGNPSAIQTLRGKRRSKKDGTTVIPALAAYTLENLDWLKELAEAGKLQPVVDRTYTLEEAAEGHRYVESGAKIGNVILVTE
ncbi:NAD(P)-dependent alcohol dehydrogenase [Aquisalinus flavus]|uniref:NADPH:quinone reductase n=1 Tax=Aquisalinus flavus TaxID=1526572 RepID=A0A8J2Y3C3_9PROT|nr:NAD(P)-dependent alcohol dehydrogenase [Aquisalinus flavus]MBD0427612.1 NAD(P)-dependent alcohol dehydrogenase [Aquisalinus flavus]UNE47400.1 NAD(P)-dependent alcohol dehydrogenase [Aquisalinus flavus]GGD02377.1 NADPH:quinone reductase [Aquisalinus flavus]